MCKLIPCTRLLCANFCRQHPSIQWFYLTNTHLLSFVLPRRSSSSFASIQDNNLVSPPPLSWFLPSAPVVCRLGSNNPTSRCTTSQVAFPRQVSWSCALTRPMMYFTRGSLTLNTTYWGSGDLRLLLQRCVNTEIEARYGTTPALGGGSVTLRTRFLNGLMSHVFYCSAQPGLGMV